MTKGEIAKENFLSGLNCAQSVLLAFKDEIKLPESDLKKLLIGFGGGFARQRLVCGAVSGMTAVIGYLKSDGDNKAEVYSIIQKACGEFKDCLGSLNCGELLSGSIRVDALPIPDKRTEEYYKKRPCGEICEIAGNIAEKYVK